MDLSKRQQTDQNAKHNRRQPMLHTRVYMYDAADVCTTDEKAMPIQYIKQQLLYNIWHVNAYTVHYAVMFIQYEIIKSASTVHMSVVSTLEVYFNPYERKDLIGMWTYSIWVFRI